MRPLIAAAALLLAASPAAAELFEAPKAGLSTQDERSRAVHVPVEFESEAQFVETRDALLDVSRDLCRRQHGSSAMRSVITRPCIADTFKGAVDQLPDTPARVALLAWWDEALNEG